MTARNMLTESLLPRQMTANHMTIAARNGGWTMIGSSYQGKTIAKKQESLEVRQRSGFMMRTPTVSIGGRERLQESGTTLVMPKMTVMTGKIGSRKKSRLDWVLLLQQWVWERL